MQEDLLTAEWIVSTLEDDPEMAALISGAYMGMIPDGKDLPAVRFHVQTPHDVRGVGTPAERIMTTLDWLIVVVSEGHLVSPLIAPCNRLDELLNDASGETSTILVQSCVRLEPFSLLEPADDSGVQYRHAGGVYRTIVQPK